MSARIVSFLLSDISPAFLFITGMLIDPMKGLINL
jgi:hypothetical protein